MFLGCEGKYCYVVESMDGRISLPLWPPPLITPLHFHKDQGPACDLDPHTWLTDARHVFREDSFDPGMRIRRGRIYGRDEKEQPRKMWVLPTANVPMSQFKSEGGYVGIDMQVFRHERLKDVACVPSRMPLVLLGVGDANSLWRIVDYERNVFGEDLVTLKAVSYLGVLPEINKASVPEAGRAKVMECVDKVVDTAYRAGPESVVDRCRDAAAALIGSFLSSTDSNVLKDDLGSLIKKFKKDEHGSQKEIVINNADIVRRLHPRAKPNAEAKHGSPPIYEADAELALQCLGSIIRELGYAAG